MLSCWGIEANALAHYRAGEKSLLSIWPPLVVSDAFIPKEDHSRASMRLIQGHFKNRRKWEALRRIELLDIYIDQDRAPDKTSRVIWISLLCWCASFHLRFWLWKPLLFMETNVNKRDKIHSSPTCQGNSFFSSSCPLPEWQCSVLSLIFKRWPQRFSLQLCPDQIQQQIWGRLDIATMRSAVRCQRGWALCL